MNLSVYYSNLWLNNIDSSQILEDRNEKLKFALLQRSAEDYNIKIRINDILIDSYGKPEVKGKEFYFSFSHSGKYLMCAADIHPIGIDLEMIKEVEIEDFKSCYSSIEFHNILKSNNRSQKLLEYWTQKESILKADGRGLTIEPSNVILNEEVGFIKNEATVWHLKTAYLDNFIFSACTKNRKSAIVFKKHF